MSDEVKKAMPKVDVGMDVWHTPQPDLQQALAQLGPGISPFGSLGLRRLEQMMGRDLTEADLQSLEPINR